MFFGVEKVPSFGMYSPVFSGYDADVLYRLKYAVLGVTSTVGYERLHLNIFRLALSNRSSYMLARALN